MLLKNTLEDLPKSVILYFILIVLIWNISYQEFKSFNKLSKLNKIMI